MTVKTITEINEEHNVWLEHQPMTVFCGLAGAKKRMCRWKFTGPVAEARAVADAHRREKHPEHAPRSRQEVVRETKQAAISKAPTQDQLAGAARRQQKSRESEPEPKPEPQAPTPTPAKDRGGRASRWSADSCVAAITAWGVVHGRAPTSKEAAAKGSGLPTPPVVTRYCGSWAAGVELAGFDRPVRGKKKRPAQAADLVAEANDDLADHADAITKRITDTVLAAVRAEHERENARLAAILRRFADHILELVQSLDPSEER